MYFHYKNYKYINIKYKNSFNKTLVIKSLLNNNLIFNKFLKIIKLIKLLSTFINYNYTVFKYSKSNLFNLKYLLSFNFKRRRFFPAVKTIQKTNLFYASLGIFFTFFKKKNHF